MACWKILHTWRFPWKHHVWFPEGHRWLAPHPFSVPRPWPWVRIVGQTLPPDCWMGVLHPRFSFLLVLSREWGNGMIIHSYYGSFLHSLLSNTQFLGKKRSTHRPISNERKYQSGYYTLQIKTRCSKDFLWADLKMARYLGPKTISFPGFPNKLDDCGSHHFQKPQCGLGNEVSSKSVSWVGGYPSVIKLG